MGGIDEDFVKLVEVQGRRLAFAVRDVLSAHGIVAVNVWPSETGWGLGGHLTIAWQRHIVMVSQSQLDAAKRILQSEHLGL